jgi:hypothetical protein
MYKSHSASVPFNLASGGQHATTALGLGIINNKIVLYIIVLFFVVCYLIVGTSGVSIVSVVLHVIIVTVSSFVSGTTKTGNQQYAGYTPLAS